MNIRFLNNKSHVLIPVLDFISQVFFTCRTSSASFSLGFILLEKNLIAPFVRFIFSFLIPNFSCAKFDSCTSCCSWRTKAAGLSSSSADATFLRGWILSGLLRGGGGAPNFFLSVWSVSWLVEIDATAFRRDEIFLTWRTVADTALVQDYCWI